MTVTLLSGLGVWAGVSSWQLVVWLGEIRSKTLKYRAARAYATALNKPLLVVGGPWGNKRLRRILRMPAHGNGDVCLDIDGNAMAGHPNGVVASVTQMPFSDKSFGAVFVSHVLEHLPTIDEVKVALRELDRVAEAVFIACPSRQSLASWVIPGHHLTVWQKAKAAYLKGAPARKA
jgi:hypothetical protein